MKQIAGIIALFFFCFFSLYAQDISNRDQKKIKALTEQRNNSTTIKKIEVALDASHEIIEKYEKYGNDERYKSIFNELTVFKEFNRGLVLLSSVINEIEKLSDYDNPEYQKLLYAVANVYFDNYYFENALSFYQKLYEINTEDEQLRLDFISDMALVKLKLNHQDAYSYFYQAVKTYQVLNKEFELANYLLKAVPFIGIQNGFLANQCINEAEEIYNKSTQFGEFEKANILKNRGLTKMFVGNFNAAFPYFHKAIYIIQNSEYPDTNLLLSAYLDITNAYNYTQVADSALYYNTLAYAVVKKLFPENSIQTANIYSSNSAAFTNKGLIDSALYYRQKSNEIKDKIFGEKGLDYASSRYWMCNIYLQKRDFIKALQYTQLSLTGNFYDIPNDSNYRKLPEIKGEFNTNAILQSLSMKIYLSDLLYIQTQNLYWKKFAHRHYVFIDTVVNILQQEVQEDVLPKLIKINQQIYLQAVNNSKFLYDTTRDKDYLKMSYALATALKSKQLSFQIYKLEKSAQTSKDDFHNEIVSLEKEIQELENNRHYQNNNQEELAEINSKILLKNLELLAVSNQLKEEKQQKYIASMQNLRIPADSIILNLDKQTALIEYYFDNKNLNIYCFTNKNLFSSEIPISNELTKKIVAYRKAIKTGISEPDANAHLSELLLAPVLNYIKQKKKLIIIPDGDLFNLPFEPMYYPGSKKFMVEKFAISYHYSSSLWLKSQKHPNQRLSPAMALFAPGFSNNGRLAEESSYRGDSAMINNQILDKSGSNLSPLPFSIEEVKGVKNLTSQKWEATTLINENATEEAFRETASDKRIVHIATHGFCSEENPEKSGLFFSQGNPNYQSLENDGVLFIGELFTFNFKSDLVVLSACKSGSGLLMQGEGLYSLPRGFIYAGSPNVVASLWKIHDEKTMTLMLEFYKQIFKGADYATALQKAKLQMIKNNELPIDWSGIILIGR
jgi:CHAT domain-containing protein